jgi:aminoglycoside 3-N-acetyltransferase I
VLEGVKAVYPRLSRRRSSRRRGVATTVIGARQVVAAGRGIYVIFVHADHGDEPAIALYSKLCVREDARHFDIEPKAASR